MEKIILASQSPRRKELLEQIGIDFECVPADIEEKNVGENPVEVVANLATSKAEYIAEKIKDKIILAADTIVECEGAILGKPNDENDARRMLRMLSGNKHTVHTGVCIIVPQKYHDIITSSELEMKNTFVCHTDVYMNTISESEIEKYLLEENYSDKAGSYGIQGKAAAFIKKIDGDYYNVVGLPVSAVYQILKRINETLL